MSRSSGSSAGKKSRHGTQTERKRARTHYIMANQTAKLADMVAKSLRSQIEEVVSRELNRRGYNYVLREGDQQDSGPPSSLPEEPSEQADSETPEPMEEA